MGVQHVERLLAQARELAVGGEQLAGRPIEHELAQRQPVGRHLRRRRVAARLCVAVVRDRRARPLEA